MCACMCSREKHTFVYVCLRHVHVFVFVCVFPHPWTASFAWSAWSAYPPQPPCLLSSSWKQARLYAEVCISLSRAWTARTHSHTHPPSFLFSSSSLFLSPPPLSTETLFPPFMLSHSISQRSSSLSLSLSPFSLSVLPLSISFPPFSFRF